MADICWSEHGVTLMGELGTTITALVLGGETLRRNLYVHGRVRTKDKPRYLGEIAVAHALRTLRNWVKETSDCSPLIRGIALSVGDVDAK